MGKGNPQRRSTGDELHTATRSGDLVAVQMILTSNPLAINSRDKHSRIPLYLAAFAGHAEIVSYLCKNKTDVGASAMDDMAAIHFATQKGHLEVVKALVATGASIKACTCKGMNSSHYAAQGSHLELVRYLAKKGASLTAKTRAGKTPLDLANNEEVRSFLEEFERSAKNIASSNKDKAEQSDPKASTLESEDNSSAKQPAVAVDEENSDGEKRETNEDDKNSDREKRKANKEDAREDSCHMAL
ncbi:uncharacterized protein LOC130945803 [Arachis stenosperma]|uniref:uncharacterized protein LOC130945803 n=1 Tax=Arachis stenosperma TaxID=217475 RepID=UPI0025ABDFB1|nr:uncharacterized protein LOC130945803 [Arachis stenosperma]